MSKFLTQVSDDFFMRKKIFFRLVCSSFALSLLFVNISTWAHEEMKEIYPLRIGDQQFLPETLYDNDWAIKKNDQDNEKGYFYKGHQVSLIDWKKIDHEEFLSFDHWLSEREKKDQSDYWKTELRLQKLKENMGQIIRCNGECYVYNSKDKISAHYLSKINEGDELRTGVNSSAWVYLTDGTLIRVASESSLNFLEISISPKKIFILLRLNMGSITSVDKNSEIEFSELLDTDLESLPLAEKLANIEHYQRQNFKNTFFADESKKQHFEALKNLKGERSETEKVMSHHFLITPTFSLELKDSSYSALSLLGGNGYFKKRDNLGSIDLFLRGYNKVSSINIESLLWNEVDPTGRIFSELEKSNVHLDFLDFLTKRYQTMAMLRELWFQRVTKSILTYIKSEKELAVFKGYALWSEDLIDKRVEFIKEYTRRIETTNLRSVENLILKMESSGETPRGVLGAQYYAHSLQSYLLGLKTAYHANKQSVKFMNELNYHVWLLKNAKK